MQLDQIEQTVERHDAAIKRIGDEQRVVNMHINDLRSRVDSWDAWGERLEAAMERAAASSDRLAELLESLRGDFQSHLLKDAADEAKLARQAVSMWLVFALGFCGWLLAFFGGAVAKVLSGLSDIGG